MLPFLCDTNHTLTRQGRVTGAMLGREKEGKSPQILFVVGLGNRELSVETCHIQVEVKVGQGDPSDLNNMLGVWKILENVFFLTTIKKGKILARNTGLCIDFWRLERITLFKEGMKAQLGFLHHVPCINLLEIQFVINKAVWDKSGFIPVLLCINIFVCSVSM